MTRQQRRAINRANSQASTGPATSEGKAVSSQNAVKHGLTALKPYLPVEEQAYSGFAADHLRRFDPQNSAERELVDTIIDTKWRLARIPAMEARLFADTPADKASDPHKVIRSLDILSRHEIRLRKLLEATLKTFFTAVGLRRNHEEKQALAHRNQESGFVSQFSPVRHAAASLEDLTQAELEDAETLLAALGSHAA